MNTNIIIMVAGFLIFIFLLALTLILIFTLDTNGSSSKTCKYEGATPQPNENEIIGGASNTLLYSTVSNKGYVEPCFVYFGKGLTFDENSYGIKLPTGIYNVYVQYYSIHAVDGDVVQVRLIKTGFSGFSKEITSQRLVGSKLATFSNNRAMTEYDTVELTSNNQILRVDSAIKAFSDETLYVDQIEVLFERVLLV